MSFARSISLAVVFLAGVVRGEITCSDRDRDGELEGVVSFYCHTEPYFFMLDDADKSWRVEFADVKKAPPLVPGCRVKVRGMFPKWATTPRMRGASVAVTGKASVPPYIELTPEEMYATDADGEPGRRSWYGRLISTSGVIRDINRRETYTQIVIGSKEMPVLVSVPFKLTDPLPSEIEIGASVRVRGVGVYAADRDGKRNVVTGVKDIQVRVEDIDDVSLLTPKQFWTAGKVGAVICILVAILFLAVGLVHRARMRDRIAADAVRRERLRLTSELHDNFQQLLAGCMFRLGAAMGKVGKDDAGAAKQLELLRDSLNHTQASLRAALWGLTEEAEGPAALTELFKYAASRMPQWEGVVRFTLRGREREVARQCSGALLLILQEAVGNALRHGHARHVDVVVDFTDTALIFGVQDDGCGFDPDDMPPAGHLGLDSMRKHAEGLGGTLTVTSEPGKGTSLTVRIPL